MTARRGERVRLIRTDDPHTDLRPGDEGTVSLVDAIGTTFVKWDSGSSLGLVAGEDEFEVITFDDMRAEFDRLEEEDDDDTLERRELLASAITRESFL